jgi:hypothetical protein
VPLNKSILKTTSIRCYQAEFSCLGSLAPGISALRNWMPGYFYWILYQDLVKSDTDMSLVALYIIIYYLTFLFFFITVNSKYCNYQAKAH